MHYLRYKNGTPLDGNAPSQRLCSIADCGKGHYGLGYCSKHYDRFKRWGDPLHESKSYKYGAGYIKDGYHIINKKPVHRQVMEDYLGRALTSNENVHHINGNRLDNRLENLELWASVQPSGQRIPDLVKYAEELLMKYAPEKLATNHQTLGDS